MRDHVEFEFQPTEIDIKNFLLSVGCSIIAMSCYTSYSNEVRDPFDKIAEGVVGTRNGFSFSLSWAYGLGWASAGVALVGTIVSSFGLFISTKDTGNPTMRFKL